MQINNLTLIAILVTCLLFTACSDDDDPKDIVRETRMEVSSETGVMYALFDDKQEHPIECMLVKTEESPDQWVPMAFGTIEGFTYERGHEYYLSVRKTILANPPADAYNCTYSLLKILSDRLVVEPEIPVDKEITSLDDIEYQALCPFDKYAINNLYIVNSEGMIRYADGHKMPGYDAARIYIEDVLPKDNSNWVKFHSVPYMAIYSYVASPLSDEIRLVRNESSGPMFKNVVPENEYHHIVNNMTSGEEIQYVMVLANVSKLGLQKVQFSIRKE
ncbi:DUF4377 domain-containing protein [uncultured Duncaniella sp.]|nr:DUF4377 domain-containing protein [uncultured Duncaniella sp.]